MRGIVERLRSGVIREDTLGRTRRIYHNPDGPEAASLIEELVGLLSRYRTETPLGHQPHMIAHLADAAIAKAKGESGLK